jgi:hypothetical protein
MKRKKRPIGRSYARVTGVKSARSALVTLLLAALLFFTAAGFTGSFLAKNVVAPVMGFLGVYEMPAPSPAGGASALPEGKTVAVTLPGYSVHYLQTGAYGVEANAAEEASRVVKVGGAGYALKDGSTIRVILQAYADEEAAKSVQARLREEQEMDSSVFSESKPETTVEVQGEEAQKKAMDTAVSAVLEGQGLLNQAVLADDEEAAREDLAQAIEKLTAARGALEEGFGMPEDGTPPGKLYTYLSDCLLQCRGADGETGTAFLSKLRYAQVMVYHGYGSFLSSL